MIGTESEYQLTDNTAVNWAPFWHPDGRHLVYATSELGHTNYEVFIIDADPGTLTTSPSSTVRYGTRKRRVTAANGADVLPAFSTDGRTMIWTSQRGADGRSQLWVADFVLDIDASPLDEPKKRRPESVRDERPMVEDPKSGLIYLYDPATHEISAYNPSTHAVRKVTDTDELEYVMTLFQNWTPP